MTSPSTDPLLGLRDIHLAPDPEFWPPAPGWWVVAAMLLIASVIGGRWFVRRYRWLRQRRRILNLLAQLAQNVDASDSSTRVAAVSALLRRVALMRFSRSEVAHLHGESWLRFLDATGGGGRFCEYPGNVLAVGPYAPNTEVDVSALIKLAEKWIKANLDGKKRHEARRESA